MSYELSEGIYYVIVLPKLLSRTGAKDKLMPTRWAVFLASGGLFDNKVPKKYKSTLAFVEDWL